MSFSKKEVMPSDFDPIAYINTPRWQASRYGLERTYELLRRLGNPQKSLKFVHVAGTNGKGSTCAYLASILKEAGYKTGLFTSPYIIEFSERIRINGENIPFEDLQKVTWRVCQCAEQMAQEFGDHPTEFELMTAVAFEYFNQKECDIVVAEVGLGGRLDSTNVIEHPEVSIITRIGLDHTSMLGSTLEEVAREKAGIIKESSPVVSYSQDDQIVTRLIKQRAEALLAPLTTVDSHSLKLGEIREGVRSFEFNGISYTTVLCGSYQPYNAATALTAVEVLIEQGWRISKQACLDGVANTFWPARFQIITNIKDFPTVILDGGHNPQGATVLADSLQEVFKEKKIVIVMSVLADKDYESMVDSIAPCAQSFICVTSPNPRALAAEKLKETVKQWSANHEQTSCIDEDIYSFENFDAACNKAALLAGQDGVICVCGSLYSVSSALEALPPFA